MQLFVRDAASYGITGVERVAPGPSSAIARLYEGAMRALEAPRIPLFVPRDQRGQTHDAGQHSSTPRPPSSLSGDVREESPDLALRARPR